MVSLFKKSALLSISIATTSLYIAAGNSAYADEKDNDYKGKNIVTRVVVPPVTPSGGVAGEPTELVAFLNAPGAPASLTFDAENFGHSIPAGGRLEFDIGGSIERNGVDNDKPFVPIGSNAFFVLVTGHPQNPIVAAAGPGVQHGNYTIHDDGGHIISAIPNAGFGDNGLENDRAQKIGVKIVHIRPAPSGSGPSAFTNGPAGTIGELSVRIYDAENKLLESGTGTIEFKSNSGRRVGLTNAGLTTGAQGSPATTTAELVESTVFQRVDPKTMLTNTVKSVPFSAGAPYAPRFLMFESHDQQPDSFIPTKGIAGVGYIVEEDEPWEADIVEDTNGNGIADDDDKEIGSIEINGPSKKSMGRILANHTLTTSGDGITGANGSVFNVPVKVGKKKGIYRVTVSLDSGSEATNTIIVE